MSDEYRADESALPVSLPPRYRFEAVLSAGGLGTVVKAYDTALRAPVAIKTIRSDLRARHPEHYEHLCDRYQHEAIAGARVHNQIGTPPPSSAMRWTTCSARWMP